MILRNTLLLIAATLSLPVDAPLSAAPAPQLGQQKFHGDWAAACDNRLNCQAVSMPAEELPPDRLTIVLGRDARSGDVTIELAFPETASDRYRLLIDGRVADTGAIPSGADKSVKVTGQDALRLARMLAMGTRAVLKDGAGKELGRLSLTGSRKAMAHIDQVQNRAGTSNALAITGRKKLRAKWAPAPVIEAKRIVPTGNIPNAAALVALAEGSECKDARFTVTEDSAYSLGTVDGKARALVLISCGAGAYNFSTAIYTGTETAAGKWDFGPAPFDYDGNGNPDAKVPILINTNWDAATQTLDSFHKGRGVGDCGTSLSYVWDGVMFRLTSAAGMEECRGSLDWMTLWHADVKLVD